MLKKPPDFGGLTHKIRKIVFSCFRCPVFAFLVSRLIQTSSTFFCELTRNAPEGVKSRFMLHEGQRFAMR